MMVADTSALMAVLMDETEGPAFHNAMRSVGMGKGDDIYHAAAQFLEYPFIRLIPFDEEQYRIATDAYRRFGRRFGSAQLNFGDTFAYALASVRGLPLLFKGDDFSLTDIAAAV